MEVAPAHRICYVQAIRWASDRLNHPGNDPSRPGVIALVHPNSLSNGTSLAGMRAALRDEFTGIYVVNLLGDAMKSGDEYRREGDKIFGQGSRNGVQITVLVRKPEKDSAEPAALRYASVPEYLTLEKKFCHGLRTSVTVTSDGFETVPVNDVHDWVNLTDGTFKELLPVCSTGAVSGSPEALIAVHASGAKTNCDTYAYSFSYAGIADKIDQLIGAYEYARHLVADGMPIEDVTRNTDLETIMWTETLKQSLRNDEEIIFDENRIREVLYRPFVKLWAL